MDLNDIFNNNMNKKNNEGIPPFETPEERQERLKAKEERKRASMEESKKNRKRNYTKEELEERKKKDEEAEQIRVEARAKAEEERKKKDEEERRQQEELDEIMKNADYAISTDGRVIVTGGTVRLVIAEWTGLPVTNFSQDEKERFRGLAGELSRSVLGQPRAVSVITKSLLRYATGMRNPDRPIGSFLLIGPTGIGKTAIVKKTAEYLFGSQKSLIRLDMSEYMEKHTISRLIGSPPGYVGYEEGGQLTDAVLTNPYSIILFDEIEKAHPDVFNLLLQILDDGILTDSNGRLVSFANTIIFLTSNLGSNVILEFVTKNWRRNDENEAKLKKQLLPVLEKRFRPEFLNRLDEMVIFYPLNENTINDIMYIMLQEIDDRLAEKGYKFLITSRVLNIIREEGYQPAYGARPLRRTITKWVADPISETLLRGDPKLKKGCTVLVDVNHWKDPTHSIALVLDTNDLFNIKNPKPKDDESEEPDEPETSQSSSDK